MVDAAYLDRSDIIETFELEECKRLLDNQLKTVHEDACEMPIDNFKGLYQRYASIRDKKGVMDPETWEETKALFFAVCEMYIKQITDAFDVAIDDEFLETHYEDLPAIALQFYAFFVLDLRSNLFNVLLNVISSHLDSIAEHFDDLRQRKDSITETNRTLVDQNIALISSNIYDVIDWVMNEMDAESFLENLEKDYIVKAPMRKMYTESTIDDGFVDALRDIMKENIDMKARISFDIICRLKGFTLS